jgi:hypothetical protein
MEPEGVETSAPSGSRTARPGPARSAPGKKTQTVRADVRR